MYFIDHYIYLVLPSILGAIAIFTLHFNVVMCTAIWGAVLHPFGGHISLLAKASAGFTYLYIDLQSDLRLMIFALTQHMAEIGFFFFFL